jgi:hypothetical protein
LAPCCKSMVPSCVSLKFHYTNWQSEAVHSFTVTFFNNVSTSHCTQHCPYHHCSQYELPFLVIDYIRNDVLLDLLFFRKMDSTTGLIKYRISRPIRHRFIPEKWGLNLTCVLRAEGKYYFQTETHQVKTTMKIILVAVMTIFWVCMTNKLNYGC